MSSQALSTPAHFPPAHFPTAHFPPAHFPCSLPPPAHPPLLTSPLLTSPAHFPPCSLPPCSLLPLGLLSTTDPVKVMKMTGPPSLLIWAKYRTVQSVLRARCVSSEYCTCLLLTYIMLTPMTHIYHFPTLPHSHL